MQFQKRTIALMLAVLTVLVGVLPLFTVGAFASETMICLSDLTPTSVTTGWGDPHYNENLEGSTLSLANAGNRLTFTKGICIHAESEISFDVSSYGLSVFTATIGMDDGSYGYKDYAGASFEVWADGVKLEDYGTKRLNDEAEEILVYLPENTSVLTLKNGHGNDGNTWSEHCNWCNARLIEDPAAIGSVDAGISSAVLFVGQTATVGAAVYDMGGNLLDPAGYTLSFSASGPATVTDGGTVTANAAGTAVITVTASKNGKSAQGTVSVTCISASSSDSFLVSSPSDSVQLLLHNDGGTLYYSVYKNGKTAVEASKIGYLTESVDLSRGFTYETKTTAAEIDETYQNYSGSFAYGHDHCIEQSFVFSKDAYFYTVTVRVYDDGYAVRSSIARRDGTSETLTVTDDKTSVKLPSGTTIWGSRISKPDMMKGASYETGYPTVSIENTEGLYILKAPIAKVEDDLWVLMSEADLYADPYIGSIFKGIGDNTLELTAGPQKCTEDGSVTNAQLDAMSDEELDTRLEAIELVDVTLSPSFTFPWRYAVVGDLSEIVGSDLTDNLNAPATGDFSWVKPGFTAWMWLSEGFSGQRNEQTIREYVDLASSLGWKYLILDEGWQPGSKVAGKSYDGYFDYFDDLLAYAESKGVGFIAWVKLRDLDTPEKREILTEWANKGIKGIKFDFVESESIDRMVNVKAIYEKCAEVHLLVNEHGGNIPTGERRTWPNVINRESVKGQEYGGVWCTDTTVMPYTRSAVGPTDITPKLEATGSDTAAHQLALTIVLESGLPCMASDTEIYYASNAKYILSHTPAAWDDTKYVDGYPGNYTILARRKGAQWFVGGITVSAKTVSFNFDFLEEGKTYTALLYKDGESRGQIALERFTAVKGDPLTVSMLQGGGFSLMLVPEEEFVPATSLSAAKNVLMLKEGTSEQIELVVAPEGVDLREISFESDNPSVAKVDAFGAVSARNAGVAHVTATIPTSGLSTSVEVRVYAEQNYELSENWTLVNGDSANPVRAGGAYSISVPILPGDTNVAPKNLYLMDAPEGDFTVTVKVSGGLYRDYDSIGLAAYAGTGNMVVMTRRFHTYFGGNVFCLSNYNNGYIEKTAPDDAPGEDAWVRLEKVGSVFTGYYSFDGVAFTKISETIAAPQVAGAEGLKIGVYGAHGNMGVSNAAVATVSDFILDGVKIPFCTSDGTIRVRLSESKQLVPSVLRAEDAFADLTFIVKDETIASVDENGVLSALSAGVTTLTVVNEKTGETETSEVRVFTIASEGYGEFVIVNPQSGKMPAVDKEDPYTLTMKTLSGDINALPKNLVLTGAPSGDFTVTVKVSGGLNRDFQSIGLVVFNESGSMVTMERRSHSYFGGNVFCASGSASSKGIYVENRRSETSPEADAYLKLVRSGDTFTGYYSYNGTSWTALNALTNEEVGSSVKLQVGLIARTGSYTAETDAVYSDFTLNGRRIPFVAQEALISLILPEPLTLPAGSTLPELPATLPGYFNTGKIADVEVTWDTSAFDPSVEGTVVLVASCGDVQAEYEVIIEKAFAKGDIDGNGEVAIPDVSALLDFLAGVGAPVGAPTDVDGDGEASIRDVSALLDMLAKA